jgi:hypothetical protein
MTKAEALGFVPVLRTDFERRSVGTECVVWSPLAPEPSALDPLAAVMLDVVDGEASIGDLAIDVHEEIGVPLEQAQDQVTRIVELFDRARLLTTSPSGAPADEEIAARTLFVGPDTPCSENASRLGTETLLLRFSGHTVRVACDSRRGARRLRGALGEQLVDGPDDAPLAFVLTAPQGLQRNHRLIDRSGFVLSEARGLDSGLHTLASHLTAFLPPAPDTVRIRVRALVSGERTVVCLAPLLFVPAIDEGVLERSGFRVIDRLALDVDLRTGEVRNPEIPWPSLSGLEGGSAHAGTGGVRPVTGVLAAAPIGSVPHTPAEMVAQLAAGGLRGSPAQLLDAAWMLVNRADLRSTRIDEQSFVETLSEFATR